jgi:hypothetical protein
MKEFPSFIFVTDKVCVNWNRRPVHLLALAAIMAQKHENLLWNRLSHLQTRYARNLLHNYLNLPLTPQNFPSDPELATDLLRQLIR